jgi:4'-phosphopantetheinyl transferase
VIRPILCPVVRATPGQAQGLPAELRVQNQRLAAREACLESAKRLGLTLAELPQEPGGRPLPVDGWHWSVSHSRGFSCGIVFPAPIGIDVEPVKQRRQDTVRAATNRSELELVGGFRWQNFTRIWSAKEAVLKKAGCGLTELSRCRVVAAPSSRALVLHHRDTHHFVFQRFRRGHWVSVSADGAGEAEIRWAWSEEAPADEVHVGGLSE